VKLNYRLSVPLVLFGIIFFIAGASSRSVFAAGQSQADCATEYIWREIRSEQFVVLYSASQISLAEEISEKYVSLLRDDLAKYAIAFSTELPTPITIRLYPTEFEYYCLNALAPLISSDDSHSHIGNREIALIAKAINARRFSWEAGALNILRHEVAVLFAEVLTDGNAPPGLLKGLGGYFEDPALTFSDLFNSSGQISQPNRGWQRLWEEDTPVSDAAVFLQQTSTIAYLVDVFGWQRFVDFLQKIAEFQGYRQALVDVYGVNLQDLQSHWMIYFPVYTQARWQANAIHNHDLSQYQVLINQGAYSDAAQRLQEAMPLIELFESGEKIVEAESLLGIARLGMDASASALEARQAILAMDYGLGLTKAEQALRLYGQLGDSRRVAELNAYQELCAEVLTLRAELDQLKGVGAPLDPVRTNRIVSIGRRLNELGDADGANKVQLALLILGAGQQVFTQWVTVIGLLSCVYLIWRRFVFLRQNYSSRVELL